MATHRFSCPSCGKTLKVDDALLARIRASSQGTHCPTCKAPVPVEGVGGPSSAAFKPPQPSDPFEFNTAPPPVRRDVAVPRGELVPNQDGPLIPAGAMTQCPFCAETIQAEARKCRFCGEFLDGGRPSRRRTARRDDDDYEDERPRARSRSEVRNETNVVVRVGGGSFPHLLHFLITLCTCGLWLPFWILIYLFSGRH